MGLGLYVVTQALESLAVLFEKMHCGSIKLSYYNYGVGWVWADSAGEAKGAAGKIFGPCFTVRFLQPSRAYIEFISSRNQELKRGH